MTPPHHEILAEFQKRGVPLSPELEEFFDLDLVHRFYRFLLENNERGGFFSRGDTERILERHLYESMVLVYYVSKSLSVSRETEVLDAGTGPGLPGFLFACAKEPARVTLLDSSRRRLSLLEEFYKEASAFPPVQFRYGRAEEMRGSYQLIVARALIPYPFVVEILSGLLRQGGHIALAATRQEDSSSESEYLSRLGFVSRETVIPDELQFLGKRSIILLHKRGEARKGYPRAWKIIKEELSKWEKS